MGLTNFRTDWPSSCVGYESGHMIYSGCSRQKSAFFWSQETTDRQSFLRETVLWSHRRDLSALSPKLLIKCLRMKKLVIIFMKRSAQPAVNSGIFIHKERMPWRHKSVSLNIHKVNIWVCRFTPWSSWRRFAIISQGHYILPIWL